MRGSDIGATILIIVLVILLIILNLLYTMKAQINKNWVKYRCNPMVIPFAGLFGKNSMQNFTFCIQQVQKNYMSFILAPTHFSLQNITAGGQEMAGSLNEIVKFFSSLRSMFGNVASGIFGVFMNIIIEFQRMIIGISDLSNKLMGLVVTILYLIEGTILTANSTWSGPVGQAVRDVGNACFSEKTKVKMHDGNYKEFKDINLGDVLSDGSEVRGVLKLKNWHTDTEMEELFYSLPNNDNDEAILVTGSHLIMYKNQYIYVRDHPDAKLTNKKDPIVYCLVTSTNNIHIGDYIFWDWEDTPQMNIEAKRFSEEKQKKQEKEEERKRKR